MERRARYFEGKMGFPFLRLRRLEPLPWGSAVSRYHRSRERGLLIRRDKCPHCHRSPNVFYLDLSEGRPLCHRCHLQAMNRRIWKAIRMRRNIPVTCEVIPGRKQVVWADQPRRG